MTQKELLYIEDAIGHESNIIAYCEEAIKTLEDEDLVSFIKKEVKGHIEMKENLMNALEEKSNE